jgi:hypothetical protein
MASVPDALTNYRAGVRLAENASAAAAAAAERPTYALQQPVSMNDLLVPGVSPSAEATISAPNPKNCGGGLPLRQDGSKNSSLYGISEELH